ncbi:hypothetical protein [Spiroplasma endosymbiont of Amphimallon solstitiale]|uniref:hypothetical protein n=1 Tax=Spiroplasma endosymbiont of Amphimallon solstitiale TaxID=3066288 RepID=UPI00313BF096
MINKLWTDVSLENYNNWYPLTGKITETPPQYINTWPNVKDWFTTFAIRAQNDINAYLDFILSKFPFDSFKDELIKETLRDMVYVMVEHWVFNRTPIEFNVDATIQFNNGTSFNASSIPTINVWDLAPSRMKIWARLTELKQVFSNYNQDEIDIEKIDLKVFYTRNQVDELIKEQKEFTLSKQIKLYDDLVNDNENEIYRGRVTNFINKGYVATDYDPKTETMILDWPDEIGTLPPEALQNNPQIGDFTHAATADFSAKQQKRITTNENSIKLLENKVDINKQNIDDIKNNWFNIETSPLWKKVKNENIKTDIWYIIDWTYYFIDSKQLIISNNKLTKSNIRITNHQIENRQIIIEKIDVNIDKVMLLYDDNLIKFIVANSTKKYTPIIHNIYQYQGTGTPTEFIAEENTERDYYTKLETNNLLDKKQDKLIAGTNITIDENNKISASGGKIDLTDYYKKEEVDKKLEDTEKKFPVAFQLNAVSQEIPNLETINKTVAGAINENKANIDKKQDKEIWKVISKSKNNREWDTFEINFNTVYRVIITLDELPVNQANIKHKVEFKTGNYLGGDYLLAKFKIKDEDVILTLTVRESSFNCSLYLKGGDINYGAILSLEELQNTIKVDVTPKIKINSKSLETNEVEENCWDIELPDNPTPSPNNQQWKDVGTREKNKWDNWQITYDFIVNKHYRVYYSWSIYNPVYTIQEFIITDNKIAGVPIQTFNDSANIVILSVQHAKWITIYTGKGNLKGNVWKLEELQE